MKKVKVVRNIWGNFMCYVGAVVEDKKGEEFDAKEWLMDKVDAGYPLSAKSEISAEAIEKHREYVK